MSDEQVFLRHILEHPSELTGRLVFADWLEERNDPRSELIRLQHALTQEVDPPNRMELEDRQYELLQSGVRSVGPFLTLPIAEGVEMNFACIPPGTFLMGSLPTEHGHDPDERQHRVTLKNGFLLGVSAVTQKQWVAVMGSNPSWFSRTPGSAIEEVIDQDTAIGGIEGFEDTDLEQLPVDSISWDDAQAFCARLSAITGKQIRLPTEAEWEYACRGGTSTPYYLGYEIDGMQTNCNGNEYSMERPTAVGTFAAAAPHPFGLWDMHGNVLQWCEDWYGPYSDAGTPSPPSEDRVLRGGSWFNWASRCRSATRVFDLPDSRRNYYGLRVCVGVDG